MKKFEFIDIDNALKSKSKACHGDHLVVSRIAISKVQVCQITMRGQQRLLFFLSHFERLLVFGHVDF